MSIKYQNQRNRVYKTAAW